MTREELIKVKAKYGMSATVERLSCLDEDPIKKVAQSVVSEGSKGNLIIKATTDEEKLNKLERDYLAYLRALGHGWIGIQNITLKLGHDTRYSPDLWTVGGNGLTAWETKGKFFRDDAKVKIKVAARLFPFINFVLVRRVKGQWEFENVKP
jgi:hypothetical protein